MPLYKVTELDGKAPIASQRLSKTHFTEKQQPNPSITMYKLVVLAALVAVATAGLLPANTLPFTTYAHAPLAYAAAPIAAPVAYSAPIAYSAPAVIPAPITYQTGYKVETEVEPVEQHGYSIKY
ncbi:uncharacterized protein LOC124169101 [Ischnura elegans]|uniref:uncharacterized protein LOC124169101 n=1 Tax=Ischnura elegans TaxID=197161 RepID=UPI001ED87012|nr:uncharacterized protein LOC124169101 [Ischnura elegans]